MNIGLFGGTFDPVHRGHIALAQAALERCKLHRVYFVPANVPPHKKRAVAAFVHRYAMLVLATDNEKRFVPSLLEAPEEDGTAHRRGAEKPNYTIETVRRLKQSLKSNDTVYLLVGMDAFADIAKWHQAEALFKECAFIVAGRPGFSLADVANALPGSLRPRIEVTRPFQKHTPCGDLVLPGVTIHLLEDLHQRVSATAIRGAAASGRPLGRFMDPSVSEYIKKTGLYR
jgi:nicotinate-nucleotide adenylyltransferase